MIFGVRLAFAAAALLVGCRYDSPFTREHVLPIESNVLGLWEPIPDDGTDPNPDERMEILRFSETEYLIIHPMADLSGPGWTPTGEYSPMYLRGYPVTIGEVSGVQVEVLVSDDRRFDLVSYTLDDGVLMCGLLNDELVDPELQSGEALEAAFLKHRDSLNLFRDYRKFRRIR